MRLVCYVRAMCQAEAGRSMLNQHSEDRGVSGIESIRSAPDFSVALVLLIACINPNRSNAYPEKSGCFVQRACSPGKQLCKRVGGL
jgi:hypothetical protein